ncbi:MULTISPECIES: molybdenum cofactor guanylyltransferase MobA [unclassified Cupriavidus]|uniref:molybdenum cofactor guanylyltransferase MobA n=1 Tax=unclassified Cupriavidus TaxID=2640874 RepID=UPI001C007710|nr:MULTISPECIES: molybdenum cofactor guanylyltransferase MobA [unclassified Cupriavidus]MCA3188036.1 molybdenum cofactor guanylyltransferase MobA [Cupriavidus sp.]MCA3191020.1 molybdenum cofactor guanylyltransferase MobA [Cupriavidus sp.]MCA3199364.1 molybdenum cofactor guanylyltransferase MobA [Cupriavidus sp.]MCA3204631.1 molybdenum cofactor guanylyltransferase MobA [Cupriavidus sp.]MCA3206483.1 molybdenum cofactor guanylyltransferase MobA [Cupriavidus sp.]
MIARDDITGLILAGGRGSRMGGTDKGLQPFRGSPMVQHTLQRLAPQAGTLLINANRNLDRYAAFGVPVIADTLADFAGPLAGMLAGLTQCQTPWLITAPCDTPFMPADLVARLARGIEDEHADIAVPVTVDADGRRRLQPVFCLMPVTAAASLRAYVEAGDRKIEKWVTGQRLAQVVFDDAQAFANINTLDELRAHEAATRSG